MFKIICFKMIIVLSLSALLLVQGDVPALGADVELSKDSTLEGILRRGELRIGLEAGYMPFEMIDKRSGLRQKGIRHGGFRRKGRQLSLIGFDIDIGIEMAKALGVNKYRFDIQCFGHLNPDIDIKADQAELTALTPKSSVANLLLS